jgi:hypothetical protein
LRALDPTLDIAPVCDPHAGLPPLEKHSDENVKAAHAHADAMLAEDQARFDREMGAAMALRDAVRAAKDC